jgi:spore coat protein U-like protein
MRSEAFAPAMRLAIIIVYGALAIAATLAASSPAHARNPNCSFTITNVSFGTVDLTANTTFDTTGTLSATCRGDNNATMRVCPNFANGTGGSNSGDPRFMLNGSTQLNYNLYSDAARTIVWGSHLDGFASTPPTIDIPLNGSGNGSANVTIYGRIWAAQQTLPPGSYSSAFSGTNTRIAYNHSTAGSCATIGTTNATSAAFTVSATYSAICKITTATLDFGSAGVLSTVTTGSSTLTATCSATTPYSIGLNGGNSGATDPTQRKMSKSAETITYGLYRDSGYTQAWGSTIGTNTQGGTGSGLGQSYTVHGRVPAQTTPSPGAFTDTIIATTTY